LKRPRVIPILSIINNRLVKTTNFKKPRYIGDPINAIKIFNDKEVDEIIVLDIRASNHNSKPNYSLIEKMASECFMPMSYGGGISTLEDAKKIFGIGVEKVVLNSICLKNKFLIEEIASLYGNQSIVASFDFKKNMWGNYNLLINGKKIKSDIKAFIKEVKLLGVGEIILTSIDKEGSFTDYDYDLLNFVTKLQVPIIINGGLSSISNMKSAFSKGVDAVAGTSFFVYRNNNINSILLSYPNQSIINSLI
jgi:imidazole glycerol-phosphate synthase subunit HisF